MLDKCNCGRPARYVDISGEETVGKCSKRSNCLPYDELVKLVESLKAEKRQLHQIAEIFYTCRESSVSFKIAETVFKNLK